jgi:AmiR/NasT family two-component response regulator
MQKGKVIIANGSPETRARLINFRSKMKLKDPIKKITMGDSIDYAIEQAERVPELENENKKLKEKIRELKEELNGE